MIREEITKISFGDQHKAPEPKSFKMANGMLSSTPSDTLKVMEDHTRCLLNQPGTADLRKVMEFLPEQKNMIEALGVPFVKEELLKAICAMKSHKACGEDAIPVEFWSYVASETLMDVMLTLFNASLESGSVSAELKDVIIQFLFKKGDKSDCNNWRTLSLINHIGKMLERMIMVRLNNAAEDNGWGPESQNGFRNQLRLVEQEVETGKLKVKVDTNPFDSLPLRLRRKSTPWSVSDILFADDAAFMSTSEKGLQKILDAADEILSAFGQMISIKKTEVLVVHRSAEEVRGQGSFCWCKDVIIQFLFKKVDKSDQSHR